MSEIESEFAASKKKDKGEKMEADCCEAEKIVFECKLDGTPITDAPYDNTIQILEGGAIRIQIGGQVVTRDPRKIHYQGWNDPTAPLKEYNEFVNACHKPLQKGGEEKLKEGWVCEYMGNGVYKLRNANYVSRDHVESKEIAHRLNRSPAKDRCSKCGLPYLSEEAGTISEVCSCAPPEDENNANHNTILPLHTPPEQGEFIPPTEDAGGEKNREGGGYQPQPSQQVEGQNPPTGGTHVNPPKPTAKDEGSALDLPEQDCENCKGHLQCKGDGYWFDEETQAIHLGMCGKCKVVNNILHESKPAAKDEGEDRLKAELAEHYSLACTGAPDCKCSICMYETGKNIGNIVTEKRAGKIIASLQAKLIEMHETNARLRKRIREQRDEKDKRIADMAEDNEELKLQIQDADAHMDEMEAKLKSAEAVVEAARNNLAEIDVLGTAYTSMKEKYEPPYVTYISWSRPLTLTALSAHDKPKQEPEEKHYLEEGS